MGQEIIRRFLSRREPGEKRTVKPFVIWLILGGILILALSKPTGNQGKEEEKPTQMQENTTLYETELEQRIQKTLSEMEGVGEVSVFLYFEDGGEQILATNRTEKSLEEEGESGFLGQQEAEADIFRWEKDGAEVPYTVKERYPQPSGVLVVAEGAKEEGIRQELYEAVRAIFGMPAHRIKITN